MLFYLDNIFDSVAYGSYELIVNLNILSYYDNLITLICEVYKGRSSEINK